MKAYSQDLQDRVIGAYKDGKTSIDNIIATFKICMDTAKYWVKRFEITGDCSLKQASSKYGCCKTLVPCTFRIV